MPLINVQVFEDELTRKQSEDLIAQITNAVTRVTSENLREVTWVMIEEVKIGHWGIGGSALGLDDVKKQMAGGRQGATTWTR